MRRLLTVIIAVLIIGFSTPISGKAVEKPEPRDVFIHSYFSEVVVRWEYSLKYSLDSETYGLTLANMTLNELRKIRDEGLYYESLGINSRVMNVLPPFYDFTEKLVILDEMILHFKEKPNPTLGRAIMVTVNQMEDYLKVIQTLKLRNGTKVLVFNVQKVQTMLNRAKELVSKVPPQKNFTIWVSNVRPYIGQEVTISGYYPGGGQVSVVIRGENSSVLVSLKTKNGTFSTEYFFQVPGNYRIFAITPNNESNVVNVTALKVPTKFLLNPTYSATIGEKVNITGVLVDYYGKSLPHAPILINGKTVLTSNNGSFTFSAYSESPKKLVFNLTFKGDSIHKGTSQVVVVEFKRYALSITLRGPDEAKAGDFIRFKGALSVNQSVPLVVYINDIPNFTIHSRDGHFNFTLKPENVGTLKVFVEFPGNGLYSKAVSNTVIVTVKPGKSQWLKYLTLTILGTLLGALYYTKRETEEETPPAEAEVERGKAIEIPGDFGSAFKLLMDAVKGRFNLSRNATPREVLKALKNWEHYNTLAIVMALHEKKVYRGIELSEEEREEFFAGVRALLGVLQ